MMKRLPLSVFGAITFVLGQSGALAQGVLPSAAASASASAEPRGLSDFGKPMPLATPDTTATPMATYHFRDAWARLVGKSFPEVILEAERAYQAGDYARAVDIDSYALLMPVSREQASIATMNRGNAYAAEGNLESALRDLNESITLDPRNAGGYVNRGLVLRRQGDAAGARKDYAEALRLDPKQWQAYFNRAHDETGDGDFGAAMADLDRALEAQPTSALALVARAALHLRLAAWDKVIADCDRASKIDQSILEAYLYRARAWAGKGDLPKAEKELETIFKAFHGPRFLVLNAVAWLRATSPAEKLRRGAEAVKLATEACETTKWEKWQTIDTLAAAYAEAGDFEKAKQYQQRTLALKLTSAEEAKVKERLALYQQRKPYREEPGS